MLDFSNGATTTQSVNAIQKKIIIENVLIIGLASKMTARVFPGIKLPEKDSFFGGLLMTSHNQLHFFQTFTINKSPGVEDKIWLSRQHINQTF